MYPSNVGGIRIVLMTIVIILVAINVISFMAKSNKSNIFIATKKVGR